MRPIQSRSDIERIVDQAVYMPPNLSACHNFNRFYKFDLSPAFYDSMNLFHPHLRIRG
jgi:hypothetical protein